MMMMMMMMISGPSFCSTQSYSKGMILIYTGPLRPYPPSWFCCKQPL